MTKGARDFVVLHRNESGLENTGSFIYLFFYFLFLSFVWLFIEFQSSPKLLLTFYKRMTHRIFVVV